MLAKLNGKIFGSRIKINGQIPSKQQFAMENPPAFGKISIDIRISSGGSSQACQIEWQTSH